MSNFMMNMISWVLLLLVILTLYLIDKVNHLAALYEPPKPAPAPEPVADESGDILFAGLEGKRLWDAMNGKPVEGFDNQLIDALRPHYEPILRGHITSTFKDGVADANEPEAGIPGSQRKIDTDRGHVQSWLPPQHLGSIYRTGVEFGGSYAQDPNPDVLARLKQTLDNVTEMLHKRTGVPLDVPYSEQLLTVEKPAEEATPEDTALALTDQSDQAQVLDDVGAQLAQGLEQVQEYEAQQRQDIAGEQAAQVVEPLALEQAVALEPEPELKPA